jgi:pescadillo protein
MGNRVKGREKKKGIKAAIGSNAGSKRKLSRMGKKQKKEHSGLEASFIGRSACIKMLQVSIKDFRRLCILKGIYPREPLGNRVPGKKKGQTYYHIKDIRAIAHEPILEKFREFRSFMKKVRVHIVERVVDCMSSWRYIY